MFWSRAHTLFVDVIHAHKHIYTHARVRTHAHIHTHPFTSEKDWGKLTFAISRWYLEFVLPVCVHIITHMHPYACSPYDIHIHVGARWDARGARHRRWLWPQRIHVTGNHWIPSSLQSCDLSRLYSRAGGGGDQCCRSATHCGSSISSSVCRVTRRVRADESAATT